jgi:hypothetical protein
VVVDGCGKTVRGRGRAGRLRGARRDAGLGGEPVQETKIRLVLHRLAEDGPSR